MADLVFVREDLQHVARCCDELAKMGWSLNQRTILQALVDSALVRYRRCFKKGVRTLITKFLELLSEEDRRLHDYLIAYCDKHIAHSVNNFETAIPVVWVGMSADGTLKRGGIGSRTRQLVLISKGQTAHLRRLALHFIDQLGSWDKKLKAIVEREASELTESLPAPGLRATSSPFSPTASSFSPTIQSAPVVMNVWANHMDDSMIVSSSQQAKAQKFIVVL